MTSDSGRSPLRLNLPVARGRAAAPGRDGSALVRHVRTVIARGYRPEHTWTTPVRYVPAGGGRAPRDAGEAAQSVRGPGTPTLALIAPSYVARAVWDEQRTGMERLLDRIAEAARAHPGVAVVCLLGMQWSALGEEAEAVRRLELLLRRAQVRTPELRCCGLVLRGPGKPRTLNAGITVAESLGCAGIGWVDDDVTLEPGCLTALVRGFLDGDCRAAVGATKVPRATRHLTSRLLHRAKAVAAPATSYPHGCCMLVPAAVVAGGLPDRYVSDDGYVCFRLLDPDRADPLHQLRLVPGARCHYHVAGPAGETRRRIRRLLLNHLIDLADWPLPVARCYFGRILFRGMWPLTRWDGSRPVAGALGNALIKWLYFCWFSAVAAELYLRGLLGRPLRRVGWAPYSAGRAPAATGQ